MGRGSTYFPGPESRASVKNNEKRVGASQEYHAMHMETPYPLKYEEMGNWKREP